MNKCLQASEHNFTSIEQVFDQHLKISFSVVQEIQSEIQMHRPSLENAQNSAKILLELNKDNPRSCSAVNDQLNTVSVPLADLLTSLEDRQGKLNKVTEVLDRYEEEKKPFEEFITVANATLEELEPFGLDEEDGKKQVKKLNVSLYIFVNYHFYLFCAFCAKICSTYLSAPRPSAYLKNSVIQLLFNSVCILLNVNILRFAVEVLCWPLLS